MAELLEFMRVWIEHIIRVLNYPGIALVMLIENLFPPIPSEFVMPFAGFLAARGELNFAGTVVAGTLGSVAGAIILYLVGMWAGEPLIRLFVRRYGRYWLLSEADLDRTIQFFARYGEAVVFFGRVIPLVRSLISIPAGMSRMPLGRFLIFTTLGAAVWTTALAAAGLALGENWELIIGFVKQYERAILVVLALGVIAFVFRRVSSLRARASAVRQQP
ncbi:MAG TPA: DedA family protein [Chloroflexota bacterium]|jgi:membrane protein DedA with SNARE-associated domain|nr:DedA family protein [Chloroflexota bacterium]